MAVHGGRGLSDLRLRRRPDGGLFYRNAVEDDFDAADLRTVIVSTDPFDLAFGNLGDGGLMRKGGDIADLIRLMAPFESLGARLCEQPRGTQIGPGEL